MINKKSKAKGKGRKQPNTLIKRVRALESAHRAEETKKFYVQQSETPLYTNTNALSCLNQINGMTQTDAANGIDGVSYILTGIRMKFLIHNTASNPALVRLAIIRLKSGQTLTTTGESLFVGSASNGLDYASATEQQRYYLTLNRNRYDIIMDKVIKVGAKNSTYTNNFNSNVLVEEYKRFNNRKEFMNSSGNPDTKYYIVGYAVDAAMDFNAGNLELTGETTFYYKDN